MLLECAVHVSNGAVEVTAYAKHNASARDTGAYVCARAALKVIARLKSDADCTSVAPGESATDRGSRSSVGLVGLLEEEQLQFIAK